MTSRTSDDDRLDPLDPLNRALGRLPSMAPDAARLARVRARCHARLASRVVRERRRRLVWKQVVAPALVGGFCVVYFALVLYDAFGARLS